MPLTMFSATVWFPGCSRQTADMVLSKKTMLSATGIEPTSASVFHSAEADVGSSGSMLAPYSFTAPVKLLT